MYSSRLMLEVSFYGPMYFHMGPHNNQSYLEVGVDFVYNIYNSVKNISKLAIISYSKNSAKLYFSYLFILQYLNFIHH
jgi:hypothetical protein